MNELATIIDSVNQLVDVEALLRLIDYHVETIQIKGGKLRCFCPLHKEVALRSLLIELSDKTYKCTMNRCDGFNGGPVVELWALYRGMELIEAAIDIAERQKLPVDLDQMRNLGSRYRQQAEEALAAGDLDKARADIAQALKIDSRNPQTRLLSADIRENAGDKKAARQERLTLFDEVFAAQDFKLARTLIDNIMALTPAEPALLERNIELARREGNAGRLHAALLELADLHGEQGDRPSEITLIEEATRVCPAERTLLERMAALYMALEQPERRLAILEKLSALLEADEEWEALLEVLQSRVQLDSDAIGIREDLVGLLERLDLGEEACQQWRCSANVASTTRPPASSPGWSNANPTMKTCWSARPNSAA